MRLQDSTSASLPGMRVNRNVSPGAKIKSDLGAPSATKSASPRSWAFPKLVTRLSDGPSRSESPVPTAPPASFLAPALPDVHTHLSLSKYCAPSPPQSPPKEQESFAPFSIRLAPLVLATTHDGPHANGPLSPVGGPSSTLSPPASESKHERRSSWSSESDSWDSFARAMERVEPSPALAEGETTPLASGSRSPTVDRTSCSSDSSPEIRSLSLKRSTGDLRGLVAEDTGLITPPSSTSSPPSPAPQRLPSDPMSSPSVASTGESSPVHTVTDSNLDLANLAIDVDPEERGRSITPQNYKMLSHSYQEFVGR